jgi:aspartate racemase
MSGNKGQLPYKQKRIGVLGNNGRTVHRMGELILEEVKSRFGVSKDQEMPPLTTITNPGLGECGFRLISGDVQDLQDSFDSSISSLSNSADIFCIPCSSLHAFVDENKLPSSLEFVSMLEEAAEFIEKNSRSDVGLIGTIANDKMDDVVVARLRKIEGLRIKETESADSVLEMILTIKSRLPGTDFSDLASKWNEALASIESDTVLLCCTELPFLLPYTDPGAFETKTLVDLTRLVAKTIARKMIEP